jgi:hypothetical protein
MIERTVPSTLSVGSLRHDCVCRAEVPFRLDRVFSYRSDKRCIVNPVPMGYSRLLVSGHHIPDFLWVNVQPSFRLESREGTTQGRQICLRNVFVADCIAIPTRTNLQFVSVSYSC